MPSGTLWGADQQACGLSPGSWKLLGDELASPRQNVPKGHDPSGLASTSPAAWPPPAEGTTLCVLPGRCARLCWWSGHSFIARRAMAMHRATCEIIAVTWGGRLPAASMILMNLFISFP